MTPRQRNDLIGLALIFIGIPLLWLLCCGGGLILLSA